MRIALATVGTSGDVRPFAALARALLDRGHAVTTVSWPVHRDALTVPGGHFIAAGPHADPGAIAATAAQAAAERNPIRQVEVLRDFHLAQAPAQYRALLDALDGRDLVLIHGIHSLAHAAVLDLGVRWASAVFDPVLLPTRSAPPAGMPNLGPLNRFGWWLLDRILARPGAALDAALADTGSPRRGLPLFRARSPLLHLVACSPSIIHVPADLPRSTRVTGAWVPPGPPGPLPADVEAFLADGEPPVVVTFGSMSGTELPAVDASVELLVATGHRIVIDSAPGSPRRGVIGVAAVDHRALFPRASVVVHHGGAGTTHTACAAGVPSVVLPHVGDQRYWADRLHRIGVAPRALAVTHLAPERLVSAIELARTDVAMRQRAKELGRRVRGEDGIGAAVALLEASAG
jgi:sterol 3beta-glucosyltransferase/vancomycin aglycone glucosyltransferase